MYITICSAYNGKMKSCKFIYGYEKITMPYYLKAKLKVH